MAAASDRPDPLPPLPPQEELSPAMRAWADTVKTRHSDLATAYLKVCDSLIESGAVGVRGSNETPDDFVSLKVAVAHAPHVHPEFARRLSASGEVETRQSGKGARRFLSLSSFLRAVRKHVG